MSNKKAPTRKQLAKMADKNGLVLTWYNPGDGFKYRIFEKWTGPAPQSKYFDGPGLFSFYDPTPRVSKFAVMSFILGWREGGSID